MKWNLKPEYRNIGPIQSKAIIKALNDPCIPTDVTNEEVYFKLKQVWDQRLEAGVEAIPMPRIRRLEPSNACPSNII